MSSFYSTSKPVNVPVRPLDKGMVRDKPGQRIPPAHYTVRGFIVQPQGLLRRPGFTTYALDQTIPYTMVDMLTLWKTDGGQITFLISDTFLYRVGLITGYSPAWWTYDTGTIALSGLLAVGNSTLWETNGIAAGDYFGLSSEYDSTRITMVPDTAGALHGDYFFVESVDTSYYVWFNTSGTPGSGDPSVVDRTGIEVQYTSAGVTTLASLVATAIGSQGDLTAGAVSSQVNVTQTEYGRITEHSDPESLGLVFSQLQLGADSSSLLEIVSVTSNSLLTLTTNALGEYPAGTEYLVRRAFKAERPHLVDWTVHLNEAVFTGKQVPLLTYNETTETLEEYVSSAAYYPAATGEFKANCVASFDDRIFVLNLDDGSDGDRRYRLRWSSQTNTRDFSLSTAYLDLPYVSGEGKALLAMGDILVAYFDDGVFFGTKTGAPSLPVAFQQIETGNKGLLGPKAVVSWLGGHFCAMQDDFYFVSSRGAEALNAPIVKETIDQCKEPWRVYAVVDPVRERIVFGFPSENEYMDKLWSFEYRTGQWSEDVIQTWMIANPLVNVNLTWDDLAGTTWDDLELSAPTWDDLNINDPRRKFYMEQSNALWVMTDDGATDPEGTAIQTIIETGDYDLDAPDRNKVGLRLSLKIESDDTLETAVMFKVWGSVNKGREWVPLGTINILPTQDEGYVNFRLSGSTIRFRLTSSSEVSSYHVSEYVIRVAPGGGEFNVGKQS